MLAMADIEQVNTAPHPLTMDRVATLITNIRLPAIRQLCFKKKLLSKTPSTVKMVKQK